VEGAYKKQVERDEGESMGKMRVSRVMAMVVVMGFMVAGAWGQTPQTAEGKQDTPLDNRSGDKGPLRVVIAGLVHGHADGFLSHAVKRTDIQIVGVQEPDRALFDQYAKKFGLDANLYHADLDEMLNATKPEAVLVYTNTFEHRKVVEICAKRSTGAKPLTVMMEKPLATTAEDARAIAKVSEASKIIVLVNYFTTWEPNRRAAYEVAKSGELGNIWKIVAHDGHGGPKEIGVGPEFLGWLTDPKLNGGGALYDFGCYGTDFITWLMGGEKPLTVTAVTQQIKPDVYPKVDDDATIILTYPKTVGIVQGSWNWAFGRSDVEIYGKTGEVKIVNRETIQVQKPGDKQPVDVTPKGLVPPMDDELTYLRAVARGELKPEGPGSLAINVVVAEILDAARESAKTGKAIRMSR
jgi:predicted dehydrogenase